MSTGSSNERGGPPHLQALQEDEQEVPDGDNNETPSSQQPLIQPPFLAACATTASSGSSSSGRRRFSSPRLGTPPAGAACLPRDDNLYASLLRYQEEQDDSTTVSMGETLRSVSTWYSVQSDDDRKIPARPNDSGHNNNNNILEGNNNALRRPYRAISRSNNTASGGAAGTAAAANDTFSSGSVTSSSGGNTPAHGNSHNKIAARYPPPAAIRRISSGSLSRSVASGPPPVVWEEDKDDYTVISSLANQTMDRSDEGSFLNSVARYPLGVLDEGCAVNVGTTCTNNNTKDFQTLSSAAQLTQESSMGNMVETTRSAPTPYGGSSDSDSNNQWECNFSNNMGHIEEDNRPSVSNSASRNTNNRSPPPSQAASTPSQQAAQQPPTSPMNDFRRMQQTLGMQDLCVPGSTNNSVTGSVHSNQSGLATGSRTQAFSVASSSANPASTDSKDSTADEQYRIWKQIQEEQERKQMELALQLSQEQAASREVEPDDSGGFVYPEQDAKPPGAEGELDEEEALKVALRLSEEEAAASKTAWRSGGTEGNDGDEDEIALALRLSKEQAEADQKRFEQMQQDELSEEEQLRLAMEQSMVNSSQRRDASGLSAASLPQHGQGDDGDDDDDEEMRRALAESLQKSDRSDSEGGGNDDDDDEMELALRLSQAQMEEEERFRRSFMDSTKMDEERTLVAGSASNKPLGHLQNGGSVAQTNLLEDSDFEPPVRSRPSQEPPSPGLPPLGHMSNSPNRWGRSDAAGMPTIQDLESPPEHVRENFRQQQNFSSDERERDLARDQAHRFAGPQRNKHASRVHCPDDGDDVVPVRRPQRRDDQNKPKPSREPAKTETESSSVVDIDKDSRDLLVREGQCETRAAILQGQSQIVTCRGCFGKLHAPINCALVFCPTCNTVSQVSGEDP